MVTLSAAGGRLAAAIFALVAGAPVAPKLEKIGPLTDQATPEALRLALEPKGVRLSLDGLFFCEVWLRKSIPAEKAESRGRSTPISAFLRPSA